MTLPNFLIIGAAKGGTTTIFNVLKQHPEVYLHPIKEVGFFWAYGQEVIIQGPGADLLKHRIVNNLDQYQALFSHANRKAVGEATVRYLSDPRSPGLIHQFIPEAKLIVSLRQPADRAFSAFVRNLRDGLETIHDFASAVDAERQGLRSGWVFGGYLEKGFYSKLISRYLEYFDRSQLNVSLIEDLRDDPQNLMHGIFQFLDIDAAFQGDLTHRYNVSGVIRNPLLRLIWTRSNQLKSIIRPLMPARLRQKASEWMIRDLEKPQFPPEIRAELTEYYRQDIEQLQDLLGRDLSHWLQPEIPAQTFEMEEPQELNWGEQ
jgi:hypothetical protein